MKVGTDAVLLGAWADVSNTHSILDIGTGSGVIALMLAQRTGGSIAIDAVEPDADSAKEAKLNFEASPWSSKLAIHLRSVQQFIPDSWYDLIVSNPPYFSKSLLPPHESRKNARHTETLSFDDLLTSVRRLLSNTGRFAVILPLTEGSRFRQLALGYGLKCIRTTAFYTRKGKPQERWLMEFSFEGKETEPEALYLYNNDEWSGEYRALTEEFYL